MDSAESELLRLVLELHRLTERRIMLERRRDELAAYLASLPAEVMPRVRPAAPDWPPPEDVSTGDWMQRFEPGEATTALRPEHYNTGALSALSQPVDCPADCVREYVHRHFADGQVVGYERR